MKTSLKRSLNKKLKSDDIIADNCLDIDIFGRQVKLTFNGRDKFKTRFGTFCTLIIVVIIISYITMHAPMMFDYRNALPVISPTPREILAELYSQDFYTNLEDKFGRGVNQNLAQAVRPNIFFAFGFGYDGLVDSKIGSFVVGEVSMYNG